MIPVAFLIGSGLFTVEIPSAITSDASFIHDFVFQYVAFRHHSFFFSHEFGLELFEPYQPGGIPWNLQEDRARRMQIDRLGNYVVSLLKARCRVMTLEASTFEYVIPPYMVRPAQVVVQLKYTAPAWPHIIVLASVCRLWNNSVSRAVSGRHMINFRRLQYTAQTRYSEHYWAHGRWDDRFSFTSDFIIEMQLMTVRSPVH